MYCSKPVSFGLTNNYGLIFLVRLLVLGKVPGFSILMLPGYWFGYYFSKFLNFLVPDRLLVNLGLIVPYYSPVPDPLFYCTPLSPLLVTVSISLIYLPLHSQNSWLCVIYNFPPLNLICTKSRPQQVAWAWLKLDTFGLKLLLLYYKLR